MVCSPHDVAVLAARARAHHLWIATAESVTAGRLAGRLAAGDHASDWFSGGVVCYSAGLKHDVLGLPRHCPVLSEECAALLAVGVRRVTGADVSVATTGVGGPGPVDGHPAGSVWIGMSGLGPTEAYGYRFSGGPLEVIERATDMALRLLVERIGELRGRGPAAPS